MNEYEFEACKNGNLDQVRELFGETSWFCEKVKYLFGKPTKNQALCWSSDYGHLKVVKYLISVGASVHANDDWPIRYASERGHLEVVEYLVSIGADVHAKDDQALRNASRSGHLDIVKFLVSVGASNFDEARQGAWAFGHKQVANILSNQ